MIHFLYALVAALGVVACSSPVSSENKGEEEKTITTSKSSFDFQADYRKRLSDKKHISKASESKEEVLQDSTEEGDYLVRIYNVKASNGIPSIDAFGQNDDLLWPGQVLNGEKFFESKSYSPITLERTPIEISLSLEGIGGSEKISATVKNPKLSTMREAINKVVEENSKASLPVKMEYKYESVFSESQMNLGFSSIFSIIPLTKSLDFGWSKKDIKTRIIFSFKQNTFSVDINTPDSVFSSKTSKSKLMDALESDFSPVYVASVNYGSAVYVTVESTLSEQELNGGLGFIGGSVSASKGVTKENTAIYVKQFGGDSKLSDEIVKQLFEGKGILSIESMLGSQTLSSAKAIPISYKLRYLDDHTIAEVVLSSEYKKKVYIKKNQEVEVTLESFKFLDDEGQGEPEVTAEVSFYAKYIDENGIEQSRVIHQETIKEKSSSPNSKQTFTFLNINPEKDRIFVEVSVVEKDVVFDDKSFGSRSYYLDQWDNTSISLIAEGEGAKSEFTFRFKKL